MKSRKALRGKRAVSHLMAVMLIMVITLVLGGALYALIIGVFSGVSRNYNVETTGSVISVDVATGDAMFLLNFRNIGTSPLRVDNIKIYANHTITILFDGTTKKPNINCTGVLSSDVAGSLYGSSPSVAVTSDSVLNIPSGQVVSLEFRTSGTTDGDMSKALELGATYNGMLYQVTSGGPAISLKFTVEG